MSEPRQIVTCAKAKELGLKRYFTGKPCGRGHVEEWYVSDNRCTACARERDRKRRSTPEGRAAHNEAARKSDHKRRSTPEGRAAAAEAKRKYLSTPEGMASHREASRRSRHKRLSTPEGLAAHREA